MPHYNYRNPGDPGYEAADRHYRNQYLHLPPRYPPAHNGYHSDNEIVDHRVSNEARVPSPPRPSYIHRAPSPPPIFRRPRTTGVYDSRRPSPPPPFKIPHIAFDYREFPLRPTHPNIPPPIEIRRRSFDDRRPRTPNATFRATDNEHIPVHRGRNSSARRPKRSQSESAPRVRFRDSTHQGRSTADKTGGAGNPPLLAFEAAHNQRGVLGDKFYQYRALQDKEFRLVRILPERQTLIKCEIHHHSLENPPPYVAISYAWGDAGDTRKIEIELSSIPVSVSLHGALEALRQKSIPVWVWVDALCINQQDRDERTQQVQLMTSIYSIANSVAIWLGPAEDDSTLAANLLSSIADQADSPDKVARLISRHAGQRDLTAVVSLFGRDYWRRLWVVQEIYNATSITVYCGPTKLPWEVYQLASHAFGKQRRALDFVFPSFKSYAKRWTILPNQLSASQVLVHQGPATLPDLRTDLGLGEDALLAVLRACRSKITSDARDKLFGILGVLPDALRKDFRADYSLSVKDVYTSIVDTLLKTTERLDVICDAIHFPIHTSSASLPSYVPDWSHIPQTAALGHKYNFSASGKTRATKDLCKFLDDRLNKLEISAVYLDTINTNGVAVGTICTLSDYLMAFLHWRALLLGSLEEDNETAEYRYVVQEQFCKTISLGQIPPAYNSSDKWLEITYHVFASLLRKRLPFLPLDRELQSYASARVDIKPEDARPFLQKHFGDRMMGRAFCRTEGGRIGMGSGLMLPGDIVVVPLGCSTPILLRLEGTRGEYRFVGDVYINGYMYGRAIDQLKDGKRELKKYVLH